MRVKKHRVHEQPTLAYLECKFVSYTLSLVSIVVNCWLISLKVDGLGSVVVLPHDSAQDNNQSLMSSREKHGSQS